MQKHVYRRTSNVGVGRSNSVDPRVRHRYIRAGAALAAALLGLVGQGKGTTAGVAPARFVKADEWDWKNSPASRRNVKDNTGNPYRYMLY